MRYTTVDNIARRLRGRLQIDTAPPVDTNLGTVLGYGQTVAGNTVDNALITQIADEKEAYIDLILSQIYVMPLQLSSYITVNILQDISECLTISGIIQVHFEGTSPVLQASDISQASMDLRRNGEYLLQSIAVSHNIWIPTTPPADQSTLQGQRQPLRLPGERLLAQADLPDTITRNYTVSGVSTAKTTNTGPRYFEDNDDCPCDSFSKRGRAYGQEPNRYCN